MALDQTGEIPLARCLPSRRLAKGLLAASGVVRQGLKEARDKGKIRVICTTTDVLLISNEIRTMKDLAPAFLLIRANHSLSEG